MIRYREAMKKRTLNEKDCVKLLKALQFYADPKTYFAIGFFPDKPCGPFLKDFDKTHLGMKPGKLARKTFLALELSIRSGKQ